MTTTGSWTLPRYARRNCAKRLYVISGAASVQLAELSRHDWRADAPQTHPCLLRMGLLLGVRARVIPEAIRPGIASADHPRGHVFAAQADATERAVVAVAGSAAHLDLPAQHTCRQCIAGLRSERLAAFRGVYALDADLPRRAAGHGAHPQRIAIRHVGHYAVEAGRGCRHCGSEQQDG